MDRKFSVLAGILLMVCMIGPLEAGVMITMETTTKSAIYITSQSWDTLSLSSTAMRNDHVTWIPDYLAIFLPDTGKQRSSVIAVYDAPIMWKLNPDSGTYSEMDLYPPKVEPQTSASDDPPLIEFGKQDVVEMEWRHAIDESGSGKPGDDSCNSLFFLSVGRSKDNSGILLVSYEVCLRPEGPGMDLYQEYQRWENKRNAANGVGSDTSLDFSGAMITQYLVVAERIARGGGIPMRTTSKVLTSSSDNPANPQLDSLFDRMDPQHFTPIPDLVAACQSIIKAGEFITFLEVAKATTSITEKDFNEDRFRVPADFEAQ